MKRVSEGLRGPLQAPSAGPQRSGKNSRPPRWRSAALLVLTAAVAAAAPGDITFAPPFLLAVGSNPRSVAAGDFNGDGKSDLVAANFTSSTVSAALGNGDATFAAAASHPVGANPAAVLLVLLNNDQHLDLVTANASSNNITVRLGSGTIAFGPAIHYPANAMPMAMTSGDFDADNDQDLAVANFTLNRVSFLRNNGDGSFAAPVSFNVGTNPRAIVAGDFNGDSKLDLAAANDLTNNVSVLLGNGDGTFAAAVNFAAGLRPFALVAGDFNGDNHLDLATGNQTSANISLLMGNGSGAFAAPVSIPMGMPVLSLAAADFNGDSNFDLVAANTGNSNVFVLQGNGNGTFQPVKTFAAGGLVAGLTAADWTGDTLPEIAAALSGANVAALRNTSTPPVSNQPPAVDAGLDQSVECAGPSGALVQLAGTASDPDGDTLSYVWTDANGAMVGTSLNPQVQVALGMHTFTLTVDDGRGGTASDSMQVTVGDTSAPSVSLSLSPTLLWPANHAMVQVTAQLNASDSCTGSPNVTLLSITSSELDNGLGDGDMPNDIQDASFGSDDRTFSLRAERSGRGSGRIYIVRYAVRDTAGNSASAEAQVVVPHSMGGNTPAQPAKAAPPRRPR